MDKILNGVARLLASRKFFIFVVVLLVFQSLWLVFSFSYSMLWDEYYHFGLIQFFAQHLNPFITSQPHSLDVYGNVARDPSWLYHYIMSFPYRLISVFTDVQATQVIALRILNVAMFAGGLVAFRQAFLRLTTSKALVHFVLFLLVLFPMSTLLAAQVSYDNLQFLLTGLVMYFALSFVRSKSFDIRWLLFTLGTGLLACVVKYTFLPIFVAVLAYIIYYIIRRWGKELVTEAQSSFRRIKISGQIGLLVLVSLGLGLFIQDYGTNLLLYGKVQPSCDQVLSVERCLSFSPYARDYIYQRQYPNPNLQGPWFFTKKWFPQLFEQYFTTGTRISYAHYSVKDPLPVPFYAGAALALIGSLCLLLASSKYVRRPEYQLVALAILALTAALWLKNYGGYVDNGRLIAVQGRYLLPMLPFFMIFGVVSANRLITSRKLKLSVTTVVVIGLLMGGGLMTHIIRADKSWYWQNQTVISVNHSVSEFLGPLTLD